MVLVGGVHMVAGERKRTRRVADERIHRQRGKHGESREQREHLAASAAIMGARGISLEALGEGWAQPGR